MVSQWADALDPAASATAFVISRNLHRRHLTVDQRALVALESFERYAAEAKERQRVGASRGRLARRKSEQTEPVTGTGRATMFAAREVGVGERSVQRARFVLSRRPDLRMPLRDGAVTLRQAEHLAKRGGSAIVEHIYFLEAVGLDAIKIGRAEFPERRLEDFQTGCPAELRLLASVGAEEGRIPGVRPWARNGETLLHRRFAAHRIRGEWFRAIPELRELVAKINRGQQ